MQKVFFEVFLSINLENQTICLNFALEITSMVPWPSGEAPVCKTVYSSSILLGTSKGIPIRDAFFVSHVPGSGESGTGTLFF